MVDSVAAAELIGLLPTTPTMVRLREHPAIFVLLFPNLESQAATLNRVAALVERASMPRDRVVAEAELAAAIAAAGETPATWYYGHDYRGADIARFFALARAGGLALNPAEQWLAERHADAASLLPEGAAFALISAPNPDTRFDAAARATILIHELAHGVFFTDRTLAAQVQAVWAERFTQADRAAFQAFLAREGYDTRDHELMANEAMAYLLFTPDARFFAPRHIGVPEAAIERMRQAMRDGAPALAAVPVIVPPPSRPPAPGR